MGNPTRITHTTRTSNSSLTPASTAWPGDTTSPGEHSPQNTAQVPGASVANHYFQSNRVRTIEYEGAGTWFVAEDIAMILDTAIRYTPAGIEEPFKFFGELPYRELGMTNHGVHLISERGLRLFMGMEFVEKGVPATIPYNRFRGWLIAGMPNTMDTPCAHDEGFACDEPVDTCDLVAPTLTNVLVVEPDDKDNVLADEYL